MARKKALKEAPDAELFRELARRHGEKTVGWGRLETPEGQAVCFGARLPARRVRALDLEAKSGPFGWILVDGADHNSAKVPRFGDVTPMTLVTPVIVEDGLAGSASTARSSRRRRQPRRRLHVEPHRIIRLNRARSKRDLDRAESTPHHVVNADAPSLSPSGERSRVLVVMSTPVRWSEDLARARISAELAARQAFLPPGAPAASALLPLLHDLQHCFGYVHEDAVPMLAHALNLSKAEVRGVISFYSDFRTTPPAAPSLKLCRAEACQAVGSERIAAHLQSKHPHVCVEEVFCLGNCALGPAALVGDELIGRLDEPRADALVKRLEPAS